MNSDIFVLQHAIITLGIKYDHPSTVWRRRTENTDGHRNAWYYW